MNSAKRGIAAIALGAALAAIGTGATPASAQTLRITTWTATSPGLKDWWPLLEQKFEAAHPGVDVKVENVAFADYIRTLTTRFVAGSAPEIIHVPLPTVNLPAWAEAGFLKSVDQRFKSSAMAPVWPANQAAMSWKGRNYGVLLVHYGFVMFYNKAMLDAAGLAVPKTPAELSAAAQAMTRDGRYGFAITDDNSPNFMRDALEFVTGMGGVWAKDGKWSFTDPKVVEALDLWRTIGSKYAPKGTDINAKRQAFYDGNVAMMIENPSVWPNVAAAAKPELVDKLKLARVPFPFVPGDTSHGFAMPDALDAKTEALVWEFIVMSASPEMMKTYVDLVKSTVARPGVDASLKATPDTTIIAEAAEGAVNLVSNDAYGVRSRFADFSTIVTQSLRTLLQGGEPTADVAAKLQAALVAKGISP